MDRTQKTTVGQSILKSYHSRANYGFLIVEPFDSHRHRGLEKFEDWDGNKYVNNQIHWVVKKVSVMKLISQVLKPDRTLTRRRDKVCLSQSLSSKVLLGNSKPTIAMLYEVGRQE
jgi:hypothetical protein